MTAIKKKYDSKNTYFEYYINTNHIPTVFIHGVGLNNKMWKAQKKILSNYSLIFYDILNHGKSTKGIKELNFKKFCNQLNNLLKFIKVKKINLVGFSLGALIAQHYASVNYNRVNKLILIGSIYKRNKKQQNLVTNRYEQAFKGKSLTIDSIKRWFSYSFLKKNPQIFNFFFRMLEKNKKKDFLPAYKVFIEADKYKICFKNFNMPTLIMTGEYDIGSTPKMSLNLKKKIKKSFLHIVKDAKHGAITEKEKEINNKIKDFLYN